MYEVGAWVGFFVVHFFLLRQGLTMQTRLALNLWPCCNLCFCVWRELTLISGMVFGTDSIGLNDDCFYSLDGME